MYEKIKIIRSKLVNNELSIGAWQQIPHASISEILGKSGYDWVAVDMEHGSVSAHQLPDLFRAIELGGSLPLVRLNESTPKECKIALDAGAGGVIAPMIETADQLEIIKKSCCWPPSGNRGVGYSRANLFGKYFDEYNVEAQSPIIVAQIEHINAVNNLEEIIKVEGLDAIIIGPYDLSASMGLTGKFEDKEFVKVMDLILNICKKNNFPCGDHIIYPDPVSISNKIDQGFRFLAYSTDAVLLHHAAELKI